MWITAALSDGTSDKVRQRGTVSPVVCPSNSVLVGEGKTSQHVRGHRSCDVTPFLSGLMSRLANHSYGWLNPCLIINMGGDIHCGDQIKSSRETLQENLTTPSSSLHMYIYLLYIPQRLLYWRHIGWLKKQLCGPLDRPSSKWQDIWSVM